MERTDFEQWKAKEVARLLALVETERRYYQEMVAALPAPLAVLSASRDIVWANRAFRRAFNLTVEEIRRRAIEQILPVEGLAEWIRDIHTPGAAAPPLSVTLGLDTYRISAVPMRNWDDESEVETLLMVEQIAGPGPIASPAPTPRAAALTQVAPALPPDLPAIVWQADAGTFEFRSVLGAAEQLLGYPAAHWLSHREFFEERIHPDDRAAVMKLYRDAVQAPGPESVAAEFRAVSSSGAALWFREAIRVSADEPRTIVGVLTPIGQRKQMENELLTAGRMEALQTFSGRLAHDINNPLMIVTGYAEELLAALPASSPQRNDVTEILAGTERLSSIAARLSDFARRHANPAARVNLGELMPSLELRLAYAAGDQVRLEFVPSAGMAVASADAAQLGSILELLAAAREGSQERTRLTVSWGAAQVNERAQLAVLAPGRYAQIVLRDDGRGVDASRQTAIFDPTPANIDLARAYTIVRQWGGDIAYSSEAFRGSAFTVYLPLVEWEPAPLPETIPEPAPAAVPEPEPEPMRETILVVDDEAGIRGLMRKILQRERYVVLEAASAEEALDMARGHAGTIDMLLTDVMLPGILGPDLARQLFAERAGIKVLYISGYTQEESVRGGDDPPGAKFLAKPFTLGALLGKVRETLEG